MSSSNEISHKGRIVKIDPDYTTVEIIAEDACSACHAKAMCGLGNSKTKAVQVPTRGWDNYAEGDDVSVVLKASMGHKAVWIAYIVPLVILMAVLLCMDAAGVGELTSGLAAIAAVGVYYVVIWLLRGKLRNEYTFNIKR